MKKTDRCLKKIISVTISMLLVLSSMALGGFQLVVNAQGLSINDLKAKFPQGAYWNHVVTGYDNWGDVLSERWDNSYADTYTWTRCATHDGAPSNGQTDCNAFNGSIQCCGFAKKLASDIYGSNCITWEATWDKSRIKRGDVVHYYGSGADPKWGHWVLIIDVNGDALTVGECNHGDLCKISWGRIIYKSKITFDGGTVDGVRRTGNIYVAPYTAPLDSHKCQYTGKVTKQPTCTETGIKTYTCSCGKSYTEKIPATGHKYVNTFVPPTTSENGYTLHKCSVCGNSYKDNPVTYENGWYYCDTLPSGITSDKYTIEYNNYYEKTQITSPGSDWKKEKLEYGKWVNSGDQYTTEYPLETSNSRVCVKDVYYHFCIPGSGINSEANYESTSKFTHYDEIPVSEHTIVTWSGDDEGHTVYVLSWDHDHTIYCKSGDTCDGSWGTHDYRSKAWYRKCVYQNRVYQEYYKYTKQSGWISTSDKSAVKVTCRYKPIHLHSYTVKVIAPTCTEKGYTIHTCSGCGNSYKDTYTDATGHSYTTKVIAPTCTEKGYTLHTCTNCEDSYKDTYTDKLEHEYGEWTITGDKAVHKCKHCGAEETKPLAASITLDRTSVSIEKGKTLTLKAVVAPDNAYSKSVSWTTTDNNIVTVSDGTVTAKGVGTAAITASTSNGKTATCIVTVTNPTVAVTGISLNKTSAAINKGSSITLTATITPSDATDKTVTWTTSNSSVATVSNGTVTAKAVGTTTITAKTSNGKTATCTVTVTDSSSVIIPTGITLNKTSATLSKGDTINIYATVLPANASDKTVTWSSSNTSVATVSKGNITAKSAGTTTITAKTSNGLTATCTVTVKGAAISQLNNTSVVNSDIVQVGDKIRVAPSANGGSGQYSSAVYYKRSTASTWKTLGKEFGNTFTQSNSTVAFQPTSEGTFNIKVVIKDTNGATAEQYFTVDVVKELELTNISVMGRFVVNLGTAIPMIGKAVGGSAPYTYSFYFKRSTNTNWKLLGEKFQTTASARFKPTATGTYDVRIDVKDSSGTIVKKFFTATVK